MDGKLVDKKPAGFKGFGGFKDWNPTMFLQLFSDYDIWHLAQDEVKYMPPFLGSIHLLAIYDRRLSHEEVHVAHQNGKVLLASYN